MNTESSTRGTKAVRALYKAARCAAMQPAGCSEAALNRAQEEEARAEAAEMMKPDGQLVNWGSEIVPIADDVLGHDVAKTPPRASSLICIVDTLAHPNMISVEASGQRIEAAQKLGVLQAAVDAAESALARNSLEKMLCHQMAAAHHAAMKLLALGTAGRLPPLETVRLTNAAARMMQVYQEALLTLQKIRTRIRPGGKRTATVQNVQVSDGGQAVIAGSVKSRR